MLKEAGFEVTLNPFERKMTLEESIETLPGFDAIIAGTEKLNGEVFSNTPDLKYICRLGAGMDSVDMDSARAHDIAVENTPSAHVDGVAELTLGGILSCLRSIGVSHHKMAQGVWKKPMGRLLRGMTVGIIGMGQVGKRLVELLVPFEVKVLAFDLSKDETFAAKHNIEFLPLEELVAHSDIISLHIPFTPEAKGIINSAFLARAKSNLMIVNASRGGLVDEDALIGFLQANPAASAYLDTFEQEPYQGTLCQLDNCTLTPHIGSYAKEVRMGMELQAAQNVINFFSK